MTFTCKFGCGEELYRGDDGYYEVLTDQKHDCPNASWNKEKVIPVTENLPNMPVKNWRAPDPSKHNPSSYITEREQFQIDTITKLNEIITRLIIIENRIDKDED